ncbi:amino acid ABC transporter substrate-binding protein [Silvanigrella aquatica]|uniref:Solute-binding protein family 3/N-terminal domain-containing protein n=1 Tax=Silvanigrella aquatica TaxID=1915309 RepID=A0A1L4D212_9BACT|nr:amino acid ABC transporter substrate-binding protein [Silvanigrella aquatica]APJ04236.1 hypothetical protein AXG55_10085 [Silvanigrella aquatica]
MINIIRYIKVFVFLFFLFFLFCMIPQIFAATIIKHNLSASQNDDSLNYELAVLKLVLDKSKNKYGSYELVKSIKMSQSRAFQELDRKNAEVNVIASMSSIDREKSAKAIRICLFKGLLGVRIPIVLKSDKDKLENVTTLKELTALSAGQVFDWPDTTVLESNKINVQTTTAYLNLFPMLVAKRFDIFPLGALEVYPIAKDRENEFNITVIDKWAIAYPTGYYFFVNKKDKNLESRIKDGFKIALQDGSFQSVFDKYNKKFLEISHLNTRKIFYLKNPILPKTTKFDDKNLWHPLIWEGFAKK